MPDNYTKGTLSSKTKKINSKRKGNAFQNKVANILKERFNTKDFANTPGSGAYATTHSLPDHLKIYGDLITPLEFKFIIECKRGYNEQGFDSFFKDNSTLWSWVEQMRRDSIASKKPSILVMAQDRRSIIIMIELIEIEEKLKEIKKYSILHNEDRVYVMLLLDDLLSLEDSFFYVS